MKNGRIGESFRSRDEEAPDSPEHPFRTVLAVAVKLPPFYHTIQNFIDFSIINNTVQ